MKTTTILITLLTLACAGNAKNIYTYQDKNGKTLFTDKKQNGKKGKIVNITYFPESNIHSYENWGGSNSTWVKKYSKNHNKFDEIINSASSKYMIDPQLIKAVMHTESGFNSNAISPVGARGLMQLMPATARRFNVANSFDPVQNIHGGAQYLSWLLKRFNGNKSLALAAYNAGEGNVDKYKGIPPFKETQQYVKKVMASYNGQHMQLASPNSNQEISKNTLLKQNGIREVKVIRRDNSFGDEFSNL